MFSGILLIFVGLFSIAGGYFDWGWFMENRRARFFSTILGSRTGGRIFYILLGIVLIGLGIWALLSIAGLI